MARDFQRKRVYLWEDTIIKPHWKSGEHLAPMTLEECRDLAREVANAPDLEVEPHRFRKGDHKYAARGGYVREPGGKSHPLLTLPTWARKPWVVIHEAAHVVTRREAFETDGDQEEAHGPNYVKFYIEMLADMLGMNEEVLRETAAEMGVKVAD